MLKTLMTGSVLALVAGLGAYFGFRGDEEIIPTPTPTATLEATATPEPSGTPEPTLEPTETPQPTTEPSPTLEAGKATDTAPIESVDVTFQDGKPLVTIVAGLPSGCAEPYSQEVMRDGDTFVITILNSVPADPNTICTAIFGTYEIQVTIGDALTSGQIYLLMVNDDLSRFSAP